MSPLHHTLLLFILLLVGSQKWRQTEWRVVHFNSCFLYDNTQPQYMYIYGGNSRQHHCQHHHQYPASIYTCVCPTHWKPTWPEGLLATFTVCYISVSECVCIYTNSKIRAKWEKKTQHTQFACLEISCHIMNFSLLLQQVRHLFCVLCFHICLFLLSRNFKRELRFYWFWTVMRNASLYSWQGWQCAVVWVCTICSSRGTLLHSYRALVNGGKYVCMCSVFVWLCKII